MTMSLKKFLAIVLVICCLLLLLTVTGRVGLRRPRNSIAVPRGSPQPAAMADSTMSMITVVPDNRTVTAASHGHIYHDKRRVNCSSTCHPCSSKPLTCGDAFSAIETRTLGNRELNHKKFKRKVVISSDMMNLFYSWFAPITSLIWYQMKWTPVVIFVESEKTVGTDPKVYNFIMKHVEAAGGEVIRVKNTLPGSDYFLGMVVASTRFAACVEDWPEDTYVLTADVDMWPLDTEAFEKHTSVPSAAHIFGGEEDPQFKVCYLGMNVSMWREVMGFKKGDKYMDVIAGMRNEVSTKKMQSQEQWFVDQKIFTKRMKAWRGFPDQVHFYGHRHVDTKNWITEGRLERAFGPDGFVYHPDFLEAHLLRPGYTAKNWGAVRALAAHLLTEEQMEFVDEYAKSFCHMVQCSDTTITKSSKSLSRDVNIKPYPNPKLANAKAGR